MRPLLLAIAFLITTALAHGVTQTDPTLEDFTRLMGGVVVLEAEMPAGARTLRVAYTLGVGDEYLEHRAPLPNEDAGTARTLRLLILAPGRAPNPWCEDEPIDVHSYFADDSSGAIALCVPLPETDSHNKHEFVLTGPMPALGTWTPVYVRAWAAVELGVAGWETGFDPAQALTIQIWPSAEEIESVSREPPLTAESLLKIPEIQDRATPRTPTSP